MSKEKQASGKLLKLGEIIKPQVDKEIVSSFVERLYGISCQEVQELNAYDDKNYKIVEDPNMKNPLITTRSVHGYVLKIINSLDSKNLSLVEAQTEILNFLSKFNNVFKNVD